jgi:hypothetical protein
MAQAIRVAMWLGDRAPRTGVVMTMRRSGVQRTPPSDPARRRVTGHSADNPLMADVLNLCESAHVHFERYGDPSARAFIDAFSIELVDLIGNYLARRLAR